jgi:hypothetical protein
MQHHLEKLGRNVRETAEYTDFESLDIYGQPNDAIMEWLPHVTGEIQFTLQPTQWGGFSRLQGLR